METQEFQMKLKILINTLVILAVLFLSSCSKQTAEVSSDFTLPKDLENCKLYIMTNGLTAIYVVKCPGVTSTMTTGKYPKTTITVDGVEYERTK